MNRTRFTFVSAALVAVMALLGAGCSTPDKAPETPEAKSQYQAPMESMRKSYGGQAKAPGAAPGQMPPPAPPR